MNYGLEKPKLSFLKSLGLRRLYEKVSGLSSNPKRIKCIFIGHPKQLGTPPVSDPKAIKDCFLNQVLSRGKVSLERIEWEDGGDLMRLLNHHFNQCVAGHRKLFLWHLHQLK